MKKFIFFHGYKEKTLFEQWEEITENYQPITYTDPNNWNRLLGGHTTMPTPSDPLWQVFPDTIRYNNPYRYDGTTNPGFITTTNPNYTITTTPNYFGQGYVTIPYNGLGTTGTAGGFSLTTSNTNGITYTTGGVGGTLTTGVATYRSGAFTSNFK